MNPKAIVSASVIVLNENREILLIRGRRGWEMPQGRMEVGESVRETAVREVREETGIDVSLTQFCGVYHNLTRGVCKERIVMAMNPENHPFLVEFHEQGAEFHE